MLISAIDDDKCPLIRELGPHADQVLKKKQMRDYKAGKPTKTRSNKRRREKTPRDWKGLFQKVLRLSVAVFSTVMIVGGGFLAVQMLIASDYFRVASVRVEAANRVSEEEIVALSDIEKGTSIFDLDLELIGRRIEENAWIAQARVDRVFPREVVIRLRERVPRAVINLGYLHYVDAHGEVFKVLSRGDRLDYPVLTGIDRDDLLDQPEQSRALLRRAVALLDGLAQRRQFNLESVSEVHIDGSEEFALFTYVGGVPVRLGQEGFSGKLDRLERIYKELEPRLSVLKYIDLNVPDRVIVKLDNTRIKAKS